MPELPEVETVSRTLNHLVAGKTIVRVTVNLARIIQRPGDKEQFSLMLAGQTFQSVERRGKFIRIVLDDLVLVSHLRMEGRYGLFQEGEPLAKHTHVIFHLADCTELRYMDVRQFGTMHLFQKGEELFMPPLHKLGVEPLDEAFTFQVFRMKLARRSTKIKPFLLNQEYIVGIGNIYVDESLFKAGIHPERTVDSLKMDEMRNLHKAIMAILQEAVDAGGSTVKSYVNGQGEMGMFQQQLKVYGRKSQPCYTCGKEIAKKIVGGRGTHICLICQPFVKKKR